MSRKGFKKKKGSLNNDLYYAYDSIEELSKAKKAQPKIKIKKKQMSINSTK